MDFNFKLTPDKGQGQCTPLEAALEYAGRWGFGVVPIQPAKSETVCTCRKGANCESPGKHPTYIKGLVEHGFKSATTDPDTIRAIWKKRPDAGVGITGGLFIDIDPRHGGTETITRLQQEHGKLPPTLTHRTGGGGWNKAFIHPDFPVSSAASALGPGVDVKSSGGVIAAPTIHPSGKPYLIIGDSEPPKLPDAWQGLLREAQKPPEPVNVPRKPDGRVDPAEIGTIPEGQRNDRLFSIARRVRDVDEVLQINRLCCPNPLPESEVRDIARRAILYAPPKAETDPAVEEAYRILEHRHRATKWSYHGDLNYTVRDFERALLENARQHGWIESGYLCADPSYRLLAKAAEMTPSTISNRVKDRMLATGRAEMVPSEDRRHSATWRIAIPETESVHTYAEVGTGGYNVTPQEVCTDRRMPIPTPLRRLRTPVFSQGDLVRRNRASVLLALDGIGWTTLGDVADRLRVSESTVRRYLADGYRYDRELGQRVPASGLVSLGLVEVDGDRLRLPKSYTARLANIDDTRYSTETRRKVRRYDPKSGRFVASVQEIGCVASAKERRIVKRKRYAEQTEAWKLKLVQDAEVESVAFDDLPPAPDPRPDGGEMTPRRAMLTGRGWECAGYSSGFASWIDPATGEQVREDIAAKIEERRIAKEAA